MLKGSMVALVTPMHPDGSIDWNSLAELVNWHVESGTHAIVSVGTTGEASTLSPEEHCDVMKRTIEYAAGRIPIIAGTGANSTSEARMFTEEAAKMGADACLLVTPYYNKPTQAGMFAHFKTIAESVDVPQILYNVPGRTSVDLENETVLKLAEIDRIVGIKDATGDLARGHALVQSVPDDFAVYSGDDGTAMEFILLGAQGNISVTANVYPELMSQLCEVALKGDAESAREINSRLLDVHQDLFLESNPIPVKYALEHLGRISSGIRLPLTRLSELERTKLESTLSKVQI